MPRPEIIAIDGPVAAGKTAVGKLLSKKLHYRFLDTGIMYRGLTWLALERGISADDEQVLGRLATQTVIRIKQGADGILIINGREVSTELRQPKVDRMVSLVARVPEVRSALVQQQREICRDGNIVVIGRDVGTVVLPRADLKLFLEASPTERAKRRYHELVQQGHDVEYNQVLEDLKMRDELDTARADSPLRPARDAVLLETDGIDLEQVTNKVLEIIGED